ncbi:hypothetical protein H5410_000969 [Solanum commersonii]|uniref:Uncharacterized protein n=1 Tax=Solanum commersonii TaxID=4109 RepID=A0A9J6AXS2_SOLCO|nr:hypothetical protein H5410_000969 [Solanum commersonii]
MNPRSIIPFLSVLSLPSLVGHSLTQHSYRFPELNIGDFSLGLHFSLLIIDVAHFTPITKTLQTRLHKLSRTLELCALIPSLSCPELAYTLGGIDTGEPLLVLTPNFDPPFF